MIPRKRSGKELSRDKISQAFGLYCNNLSIAQISREVGVCRASIARYRDRENWDKRKLETLQRAQHREDTQVVNVQSRYINLGRLLQSKGMQKIQVIGVEDMDARVAMDFVKAGIEIEKDAMGKGEQKIEIQIKLPAGYEDI